MHIIKLNFRERSYSYNIIIGNGIMKFLGRQLSNLNIGQNAYVITNASIQHKYGKLLNSILKQEHFDIKVNLIPDTEKSKSIEMVYSLIKDIATQDKKKQIFIVAFGGGVIGDLAGFIASIYKRAVPYIQIPTTLLAQVDSSIGGKTGIDLAEGKNLVGSFYQPRLVFSDIGFLNTLSIKQLQTGLSEVIKYGIIKDPQLFAYLEKRYKDIFLLNGLALEFIIKRCCYIKATIVQQDEREEKGIRTILNFGHTIGHAIEAAGDFKVYNHGEAIALGMLLACDISRNLKLINNKILERIESLVRTVGLPTRIEKLSMLNIIQAHYYDKKFIGKKNKFVLIKDIGKTQIVENIPLRLIKNVLKRRLD